MSDWRETPSGDCGGGTELFSEEGRETSAA